MIKTGLSLNNVIDIIIEDLMDSERNGKKYVAVKNEHLEFLIKVINKLKEKKNIRTNYDSK